MDVQARKFPHRQFDIPSRRGSRLYEVNQWMWKYGRPKKREFEWEEQQESLKRKLRETVEKRNDTRARKRCLSEKYSLTTTVTTTIVEEYEEEQYVVPHSDTTGLSQGDDEEESDDLSSQNDE